MKNIMLIGFMATGKSAVARGICREYQMELVEMDEEIEKKEGRKISDIFEEDGEAYFRELETAFLRGINEKENQVVSCGGGVVLRRENVELMKQNGAVVLLKASPETILERVKRNHNRPLLEGNKNIAFIKKMMDERKDKYLEAADIIIATDGKGVKAICREIMSKVENNKRKN